MTVNLATNGSKNFTDIVERLRGDRILGQASYQALARMLPYAVERFLDSGAILYRAGNPARELYLVLEGTVELVGRSGHRLSPPEKWVGQEAATDVPYYFSDAVASTPVRVLAISRAGLRVLLTTNQGLKGEFYISLMESLGGGLIHGDIKKDENSATKLPVNTWLSIIGWSLAIIFPAIVLFIGTGWTELPRNAIYFIAILMATLIMWIFNFTDEYVPGIFALLTTLAMGLVPINISLAGLASEGFVLALSMLGLGTVMVTSGLSYRLLLLLMLKLPDRPFWHNTGLLLTGFLLTPLVPSTNARVTLITPLTRDIMEISRCLPKGPVATALIVSAFTGVNLLSSVFLSGQLFNFVVLGWLPEQIQDQFDWLRWTCAAAAVGIIMVLSHLLLTAFMFRANEYSNLPKERIAAQLSLLGNLHHHEWAALLGIFLFTLAMLTSFLHKIQSAWMALAVFYGLLAFGILGKNEFRKEIDWAFLMQLSAMMSITTTFHYLRLDTILTQSLPWIGEIMRNNFSLFLLALVLLIFLIRIMLPSIATILIMMIVLVPIANNAGVNPWLIGFFILILGEMWFFPHQCPYYPQLQEMIGVTNEKIFLRFNAFSNLIKLVALYISIPYWGLLGLL
ncbi:TRAP transporter large permease subunit [Gammaproteobacteria bacterium]